eukprot:COSAG02_NODE_14_length_56855_cov_512.793661_12_plen_76_part_00
MHELHDVEQEQILIFLVEVTTHEVHDGSTVVRTGMQFSLPFANKSLVLQTQDIFRLTVQELLLPVCSASQVHYHC